MVVDELAKLLHDLKGVAQEVALINRHWQNYVEYKAIYQAEFGG